MRLGTCVAVELAVGTAMAAVLVVGARHGWAELQRLQGPAPAMGATTVERTPRLPIDGMVQPVATLPRAAPAAQAAEMFDGVRDELLLEPLRTGRITAVKFNRGGSSISLRFDLDNGARGAFKPNQTNFQTVPRRELAAYRVNRLLGLSTVAPVIGRAFEPAEILAALRPDSVEFATRLQDEMILEPDGQVAGMLAWWIPAIQRARIQGFLIDETDGIVTWKRLLTVGNDIPPEDWELVAQISDMVLFDLVINNSDRWSGRNAMASPDGSVLYFMDNTLAFGTSSLGHSRTRTYLQRAQKFSRSLVMRLRQLRVEEVREAMSHDLGPFPFLLSEEEIQALMARRDVALHYIDDLISLHGEDAVLVFP